MLSGIIRHLPVAAAAVALAVAAVMMPGTAAADPSQDQKFFDLLGQKDIPPVDNDNSLIETAHKACAKLDGGMPVGDLVDLIRNNGFNENPLTRLNPPDRITRTITQFITASVEAYCPYDRGKIASIAAYQPTPPSGPASPLVRLAAFVRPAPAGDIAPTKPLPVPEKPPPTPEELAPAPQQPPPPPRRVQQAPPKQQQPEPPPEERPAPPEAPAPPVEPPQAPVPAPQPGGDTGPAPAPDNPPPATHSPPGHIRVAP